MLSMLSTGLGHIYCGRFVAGLALFFTSLLPVPLAMAAAFSQSPSATLWGLILPCLFVVVVYLYAIIDSYRLAGKADDRYELKDYNRRIVYALFVGAGIIYPFAVIMHIRTSVFEAYSCPTKSMSPTLLQGDQFLVNKLVQRKLPQRGNVIVFLCPENRDIRYVKRVIGLPGDTVAVRGNDVYVNGRKLEHESIAVSNSDQMPAEHADGESASEANGDASYRIQLAAGAAKAVDYPETKVPQGHCFVLGDNRNQAADSRRFGFVPLGDILGNAQYIYWPAQRWSRFGPIDQYGSLQ